ncbi:hypothetical protein Tco_0237831 [Tanacetum coccineum]
MTAKRLEDIHNFKQEGDESLYQAWKRYNDLIYKCPIHDINSHQKVNIFYKGLSTMNRQMLDSHGPITGMTPAQALTAIQTMADHSQKWHDGTTSRNIESSSSNDGLAALVGCQICEGPRLDKDYPLNEEVKQVKEVRYREFGRTTPFNGNNGGKFRVGPPGILRNMITIYHMVERGTSSKTSRGICTNNPSSKASSQESNNHRPRDYTFREWTLIKVGYTDISEPVKKALLKLWLIDYFQDDSAIINNPTHRSFDDYKWEFNLEIDKLADEYEIGIWEKGHILDNIWEYCNQVHNDNNGWHNHEFKNEEREEMGIEDEDYHPPEVQVETFKVKNTHLEVDKVLSMFPKT